MADGRREDDRVRLVVVEQRLQVGVRGARRPRRAPRGRPRVGAVGSGSATATTRAPVDAFERGKVPGLGESPAAHDPDGDLVGHSTLASSATLPRASRRSTGSGPAKIALHDTHGYGDRGDQVMERVETHADHGADDALTPHEECVEGSG